MLPHTLCSSCTVEAEITSSPATNLRTRARPVLPRVRARARVRIDEPAEVVHEDRDVGHAKAKVAKRHPAELLERRGTHDPS